MRIRITLAVVCISIAASISAGMDDARLKERLTGGLFELMIWKGFDIKNSGVTEEQLHRVLMELYREAEDKWPTLTPATDEWNYNQKIVEGVLACLPMCGDIPVKEFLLEYAVTKEKDSVTRGIAVLSLLRVADAEEAKAALIRFLVGEEKMDDMTRLSLYQYAQMAWHEADSMEKKAAILAALYLALSAESPPWVFRVGDQIVREMSPRYANSKERLVLLERALAQPFPERRERTKRELASRLEEIRKLTILTTINTNLAVLQARDFNQPLSEEELADLTIPPPVASVADEPAQDKPQRPTRTGRYVIGGAAILALAAAVVWVLSRRSHV